MPDLVSLLDLHDRLVASCVGIVDDEIIETEASVGRAARRRTGYLADAVVVALAGGTGSGKSSLLNALAGEEVSIAGSVRPTTAEPVAWIPSNPEPGLVRLLDDLGVENRVGHDRPEGLAILDLPDTDSVVMEHRQTVDRLVPLVDVVVWVVDPEKYKDDRLHRELLRPLAAHGSRFVIALNQTDRVPAHALGELIEDLRATLVDDGLEDPIIVPTAGDPPLGDPRGLDELIDAVRRLGSAREIVTRRIVRQLGESADRLVAPLGGVGGTGFPSRWIQARNTTANALASAVDDGLAQTAPSTARQDAAAVSSLVGGRSPSRALSVDRVHVSGAVSTAIGDLVDETSRRLDPASRQHLAEVGPDIDAEIAAVATYLAATTDVALDEPPTWWSRVRLLSYGAVLTIVVGLALVVDGLRADRALSLGVLVAIVGAGGLIAIRAAVRRSAHARVARAVRDRRSAEIAVAELERRIGRPLRTVLRERSAPGAVHTELMLAISQFEEK